MQTRQSVVDLPASLVEALAGPPAPAIPKGPASREHARTLRLLRALGSHAEIEHLMAGLVEMAPGRPEDHEALAFAAFQEGRHDVAREFYARVTQAIPQDALAWYNLATSERNLGRLAEAEAACARALSLAPTMTQAALLRSQLRTQTGARNHVDELRAMIARGQGDTNGRIFLHYALGKELDDLGEFAAAFEQFSLGASARRKLLRYDVAQDLGKLDRITQSFSPARLAEAPPLAEPGYAFVVGLPRSGTTMIERIVTGSGQARSNGETDNLYGALGECSGEGEGDVFDRVAAARADAVTAAYARRAGVPEAGTLIVEKLPFNYLYAGSIRLTLPRARTLLVHRAPADNLFAMYSTLFGSGYPFSYTFGELAEYYGAYRALIAHWRATIGPQLREAAYEDVVTDPAGEGQRIADHFGLSWDDGMVRIENNTAPTATASAVQVRMPIYTSATGRWRNYAPYLGELFAGLERKGIDPFVSPKSSQA